MFSPVGRKKLAGHGEDVLLLRGVETDWGLYSGFPAYRYPRFSAVDPREPISGLLLFAKILCIDSPN